MSPAAALKIPEVPHMHSSRRQNRETFVRLFQGFVNEYGEVVGKRIMKHIVDNAGGIRMDVPARNPGLNQYVKLDNDPLHGCGVDFRRLWRSTCKEFGHNSGQTIMNKIVCELGNQRVYFPCHKEIYRWERNEMMKNQYSKDPNIKALALRWGMSVPQAQHIVEEEDD